MNQNGILGPMAFRGFGADEQEGAPVDPVAPVVVNDAAPLPPEGAEEMAFLYYSVFGPLGAALGAYHGWKRTGNWGWAIAWGVGGYMAPIFTIPISLAQGFGKPKGR